MTKYDHLLRFQQRLLDQVATSLNEIARGGTSAGILLIGPSGAGKSLVLSFIEQMHPRSMLGNQKLTPCVRIRARSNADSRSIATDILAALNKPALSSRTTLNVLEVDMHRALAAQRTQIFAMEEAHNATLFGSPKMRGEAARLIKNMWNLGTTDKPTELTGRVEQDPKVHRMVLILSGTEALLEVVKPDKELRTRFPCLIRAELTSFSPPESFKAFRYVLRSQIHNAGLEALLDAKDDTLVSRCMLACEGHLRDLWSLLQRTKTLSESPPNDAGTEALLASAFDSAFGDSDRRENPFRLSDTELAAAVEREMRMHRLNRSGGK